MSEQRTYNVKVDADDLDKFVKKAKEIGRKNTDLTREFIKAFNEDRMTITPSETQLKQSELYKKEN